LLSSIDAIFPGFLALKKSQGKRQKERGTGNDRQKRMGQWPMEGEMTLFTQTKNALPPHPQAHSFLPSRGELPLPLARSILLKLRAKCGRKLDGRKEGSADRKRILNFDERK
jgi:hypothetical protein